MAKKQKLHILSWLWLVLLALQSLLLFILIMHPRVPNTARVIACGGTIVLLVVLYSWSKVDNVLRQKLDAYLYERGASLFVMYVARAVLFLFGFGIMVSIIVALLLRFEQN